MLLKQLFTGLTSKRDGRRSHRRAASAFVSRKQSYRLSQPESLERRVVLDGNSLETDTVDGGLAFSTSVPASQYLEVSSLSTTFNDSLIQEAAGSFLSATIERHDSTVVEGSRIISWSGGLTGTVDLDDWSFSFEASASYHYDTVTEADRLQLSGTGLLPIGDNGKTISLDMNNLLFINGALQGFEALGAGEFVVGSGSLSFDTALFRYDVARDAIEASGQAAISLGERSVAIQLDEVGIQISGGQLTAVSGRVHDTLALSERELLIEGSVSYIAADVTATEDHGTFVVNGSVVVESDGETQNLEIADTDVYALLQGNLSLCKADLPDSFEVAGLQFELTGVTAQYDIETGAASYAGTVRATINGRQLTATVDTLEIVDRGFGPEVVLFRGGLNGELSLQNGGVLDLRDVDLHLDKRLHVPPVALMSGRIKVYGEKDGIQNMSLDATLSHFSISSGILRIEAEVSQGYVQLDQRRVKIDPSAPVQFLFQEFANGETVIGLSGSVLVAFGANRLRASLLESSVGATDGWRIENFETKRFHGALEGSIQIDGMEIDLDLAGMNLNLGSGRFQFYGSGKIRPVTEDINGTGMYEIGLAFTGPGLVFDQQGLESVHATATGSFVVADTTVNIQSLSIGYVRSTNAYVAGRFTFSGNVGLLVGDNSFDVALGVDGLVVSSQGIDAFHGSLQSGFELGGAQFDSMGLNASVLMKRQPTADGEFRRWFEIGGSIGLAFGDGGSSVTLALSEMQIFDGQVKTLTGGLSGTLVLGNTHATLSSATVRYNIAENKVDVQGSVSLAVDQQNVTLAISSIEFDSGKLIRLDAAVTSGQFDVAGATVDVQGLTARYQSDAGQESLQFSGTVALTLTVGGFAQTIDCTLSDLRFYASDTNSPLQLLALRGVVNANVIVSGTTVTIHGIIEFDAGSLTTTDDNRLAFGGEVALNIDGQTLSMVLGEGDSFFFKNGIFSIQGVINGAIVLGGTTVDFTRSAILFTSSDGWKITGGVAFLIGESWFDFTLEGDGILIQEGQLTSLNATVSGNASTILQLGLTELSLSGLSASYRRDASKLQFDGSIAVSVGQQSVGLELIDTGLVLVGGQLDSFQGIFTTAVNLTMDNGYGFDFLLSNASVVYDASLDGLAIGGMLTAEWSRENGSQTGGNFSVEVPPGGLNLTSQSVRSFSGTASGSLPIHLVADQEMALTLDGLDVSYVAESSTLSMLGNIGIDVLGNSMRVELAEDGLVVVDGELVSVSGFTDNSFVIEGLHGTLSGDVNYVSAEDRLTVIGGRFSVGSNAGTLDFSIEDVSLDVLGGQLSSFAGNATGRILMGNGELDLNGVVVSKIGAHLQFSGPAAARVGSNSINVTFGGTDDDGTGLPGLQFIDGELVSGYGHVVGSFEYGDNSLSINATANYHTGDNGDHQLDLSGQAEGLIAGQSVNLTLEDVNLFDVLNGEFSGVDASISGPLSLSVDGVSIVVEDVRVRFEDDVRHYFGDAQVMIYGGTAVQQLAVENAALTLAGDELQAFSGSFSGSGSTSMLPFGDLSLDLAGVNVSFNGSTENSTLELDGHAVLSSPDLFSINVGIEESRFASGELTLLHGTANGDLTVGSADFTATDLGFEFAQNLEIDSTRLNLSGDLQISVGESNLAVLIDDGGLSVVNGAIETFTGTVSGGVDLGSNANLTIAPNNPLNLDYNVLTRDLAISGELAMVIGDNSVAVELSQHNGLVIDGGGIAAMDATISGNFTAGGTSLNSTGMSVVYDRGSLQPLFFGGSVTALVAGGQEVTFSLAEDNGLVLNADGSINQLSGDVAAVLNVNGANLSLNTSVEYEKSSDSLMLTGTAVIDAAGQSLNVAVTELQILNGEITSLAASLSGTLTMESIDFDVSDVTMSYDNLESTLVFNGLIRASIAGQCFEVSVEELRFVDGQLSVLHGSLTKRLVAGNTSLDVSSLTMLYNTHSDHLSFTGNIAMAVGEQTLNVQVLPNGLVFDADGLKRFDAVIDQSITIAGFTASITDGRIQYQRASTVSENQFEVHGNLVASLNDQTVSLQLVGGGLVVKGGEITQIDARLSTELSLGDVQVTLEDVAVNYSASSENWLFNGNGSIDLGSVGNLSVDLTYARLEQNVLTELSANLSGELTLLGSTLSAQDVKLDYREREQTTVISGSFSAPILGNEFIVSLAEDNGLVIVGGELISMDAAISGALVLGGSDFTMKQTRFNYVAGTQTTESILGVSGAASVSSGDNFSLELDLGSKTSPGLVLQDGDLVRIDAIAAGYFEAAGMSFEANSLAVQYEESSATWELSGNTALYVASERYDVVLGGVDESGAALPGVRVVDGEIESFAGSFSGGVSLAGAQVDIENADLIYTAATETLVGTLAGNASLAAAGLFDFTLDVGTNVQPATFAFSSGSIESFDAPLSGAIDVAGATVNLSGSLISYQSDLDRVTIQASGNATLTGDGYSLAFQSGNEVGPTTFIIEAGSLTNLNANVSGTVVMAGVAVEIEAATVDYNSANEQLAVTVAGGINLSVGAITAAINVSGPSNNTGSTFVIHQGDVQSFSGALSGEFAVSGFGIELDQASVQYSAASLDDGSDDTFVITAAASMSVENLFDVSFVVGQQNGGMPLTIAGGEIQSFAASASGQLTLGGGAMAVGLGAFVLYDPANDILGLAGEVAWSGENINLNVALGDVNSLEPGLVFKDGTIASLDAQLSGGGLSIAGLTLAPDNARLLYRRAPTEQEDPTFGISGGFRIETDEFNFTLSVGNDSSNTPGMLINEGSVASLNASLSSSFILGGTELAFQNMEIAYSRVEDTLAFRGQAVLSISGPEGPGTIDVRVGDEHSDGVIFAGGQLTKFVAAVTTDNLNFGFVSFVSRDLRVDYRLQNSQFEITGMAGIEIAGRSVNIGFSQDAPLLIQNGRWILQGVEGEIDGAFPLGPVDVIAENFFFSIRFGDDPFLALSGGLVVDLKLTDSTNPSISFGNDTAHPGLVLRNGVIELHAVEVTLPTIHFGVFSLDDTRFKFNRQGSRPATVAIGTEITITALQQSFGADVYIDSGRLRRVEVSWRGSVPIAGVVNLTGLAGVVTFNTNNQPGVSAFEVDLEATFSLIGQLNFGGRSFSILDATAGVNLTQDQLTLDAELRLLPGVFGRNGLPAEAVIILQWSPRAQFDARISFSFDVGDMLFVDGDGLVFSMNSDRVFARGNVAIRVDNLPFPFRFASGSQLGAGLALKASRQPSGSFVSAYATFGTGWSSSTVHIYHNFTTGNSSVDWGMPCSPAFRYVHNYQIPRVRSSGGQFGPQFAMSSLITNTNELEDAYLGHGFLVDDNVKLATFEFNWEKSCELEPKIIKLVDPRGQHYDIDVASIGDSHKPFLESRYDEELGKTVSQPCFPEGLEIGGHNFLLLRESEDANQFYLMARSNTPGQALEAGEWILEIETPLVDDYDADIHLGDVLMHTEYLETATELMVQKIVKNGQGVGTAEVSYEWDISSSMLQTGTFELIARNLESGEETTLDSWKATEAVGAGARNVEFSSLGCKYDLEVFLRFDDRGLGGSLHTKDSPALAVGTIESSIEITLTSQEGAAIVGDTVVLQRFVEGSGQGDANARLAKSNWETVYQSVTEAGGRSEALLPEGEYRVVVKSSDPDLWMTHDEVLVYPIYGGVAHEFTLTASNSVNLDFELTDQTPFDFTTEFKLSPRDIAFLDSPQIVDLDASSSIVTQVPPGSVVEKWDVVRNQWVDVSAPVTTSNVSELIRLLQLRSIQKDDQIRWVPNKAAKVSQDGNISPAVAQLHVVHPLPGLVEYGIVGGRKIGQHVTKTNGLGKLRINAQTGEYLFTPSTNRLDGIVYGPADPQENPRQKPFVLEPQGRGLGWSAFVTFATDGRHTTKSLFNICVPPQENGINSSFARGRNLTNGTEEIIQLAASATELIESEVVSRTDFIDFSIVSSNERVHLDDIELFFDEKLISLYKAELIEHGSKVSPDGRRYRMYRLSGIGGLTRDLGSYMFTVNLSDGQVSTAWRKGLAD